MKTRILKIFAIVVSLYMASCFMAKAAAPAEIPEGKARIIFQVDSLMYGNIGAHLLLDSTARSYTLYRYGLPSSLNPTANWRNRAQFYDTNFAFRIPANAAVSDSIPMGLLYNTSDTLDIPAGVYDYVVTYYSNMGYLNKSSGESARDDMRFEAGEAYMLSLDERTMVTMKTPFEISVVSAILPSWGHELSNKDKVALRVYNNGLSPITSFTACYSINKKDTVEEVVNCDIAPGDSLTYEFIQNPDFSAIGWLSIQFFVKMENDFNDKNNALAAMSLYHPAVRTIPFLESFESADSLRHWQMFNNDPYSNKWMFETRNKLAADSTNGYIKGSKNRLAAVWLISDPFHVDSGIQHVGFYYLGGSELNPERLELWYGFSTDVEEMKLAGGVNSLKSPVSSPTPPYPAVWTYDWQQAVFNIHFEKDSVYYFAFKLASENTNSTIYIDEVSFDTGKYDLIPDMEIMSLILPRPSCTLDKETIGVNVRNAGKLPMNGYTLAYKVNSGKWLSETFTDTLAPTESKKVYLSNLVDFSEVGRYTVMVAGSCEGQDNFGNDTLEAVLMHYAPVAEYPYFTDFTDKDDEHIGEWYSDMAWTETEYGVKPASTMYSRCMDLKAGFYRMTISYKAGVYSGYQPTYDEFSILYTIAGDTAKHIVADLTKQYDEMVKVFDTLFNVEKDSTYIFRIDPYGANALHIASFAIEEALDYDISLTSLTSSTLAKTMPLSQTGAAHSFSATVRNRGSKIPKKMSVRMSVPGGEDMTTEELGAISFMIPEVKTASSLRITGTALFDTVDQNPADNVRYIDLQLSDSVMACENAVSGKRIPGQYKGNVVHGNIFTLVNADTLSSVSASLTVLSQPDNLNFMVCKVEKDTLGNYQIKDTLSRSTFARLDLPGLQTYSVTRLVLEPGSYLFALSSARPEPGFMGDSTMDGFYYTINDRNELTKASGYGNLILRVNFGPQPPLYASADVEAVMIEGPADSTQMGTAEKLIASLVNNADFALQNVPVRWIIDGKTYMDTVDMEKTTLLKLERTADFSQEGAHTVCVRVLWYDDPDHSNDSVSRTFVCYEKNDVANKTDGKVQISMYPNPASSVLRISSPVMIEHVTMFDLNGRLVYAGAFLAQNVELKVDSLLDGIYMLQVQTAKGVVVEKLIIRR